MIFFFFRSARVYPDTALPDVLLRFSSKAESISDLFGAQRKRLIINYEFFRSLFLIIRKTGRKSGKVNNRFNYLFSYSCTYVKNIRRYVKFSQHIYIGPGTIFSYHKLFTYILISQFCFFKFSFLVHLRTFWAKLILVFFFLQSDSFIQL